MYYGKPCVVYYLRDISSDTGEKAWPLLRILHCSLLLTVGSYMQGPSRINENPGRLFYLLWAPLCIAHWNYIGGWLLRNPTGQAPPYKPG